MSRWRMIFGYILLPLGIDILLAWFLLAKQLPDSRATVLFLLRMTPDLGLLVLLTLLFTLGGGPLRTLFMLQILFRKASSKQESSIQKQSLGQVA